MYDFSSTSSTFIRMHYPSAQILQVFQHHLRTYGDDVALLLVQVDVVVFPRNLYAFMHERDLFVQRSTIVGKCLSNKRQCAVKSMNDKICVDNTL